MSRSNCSQKRAVRPRVRPRFSRLAVACVGAGFFSLAAAAHAQSPAPDGVKSGVRYERASGKVRSRNNLETKVKAAKAQAEREKGPPRDMLSADDFARAHKAAVAQQISQDQIQTLKRLIDTTDRTDEKMPDYLFRLADHYLDNKAYFEQQSGALYEVIDEAKKAGAKARVEQLRAKQASFDKEAKAAGASAVDVYKVLVTNKRFSKYGKLDQALYFYAFELGQLGREAEMKDAYVRLIQEHPQSKFIPNAFLAFADYYYGENKIDEALQLYQKIVDGYQDSPVYAYALYKMAWCHLNPSGGVGPQYEKSLQKFVQTVQATNEGRAGSEGNAKQLRRDARRDMIKAYVHAGKPSRAWELFAKIGNGPSKAEDMAKPMMELLAAAYFGEGMYVESSATYKTLQKTFAEDPARCDWQARVVVNALATDDKAIQWQETQRLRDYWDQYRGSSVKAALQKKCRDETRDSIQQMATVWHDEAEKTRRADTYGLAEEAYRAFLDAFPKDKDAYEIGYYYAEILWAQASNDYNSRDVATKKRGLEKFLQAHEQFMRVLERKPKGKHTKDAAFAQMLAMKNYLEYDETGSSGIACTVNTEGVCVYTTRERRRAPSADADTYPETPYTEIEAKMLAAYDTYQKYVADPKDKELPKIQFHRAKLMMQHNRFDDAKPILVELVTKFDGTVYAAWSSEMLVDLLTIRWLYETNSPERKIAAGDELERWANKLQTMKVWKHAEADRIRTAVPNLVAAVGWTRADALCEKGRAGDPEAFVQCAEQYLSIYNAHENHDRPDILLFNAARAFEAAHLVGRAIALRNELIAAYPQSQVYRQTLQEVAQNYQAVAFYEKAADRMEQYADKYGKDPKDPFVADALQNAFLFRSGLGDERKAEEDRKKYEGLYKSKDPGTAAKIFWSRNDALTDSDAKVVHAREYLATYGTKGGLDRQAVATAVIGQVLWRQSCGKNLPFDSCVSVTRKQANTGEKVRARANDLRTRTRNRDAIPKHCGAPTQGIVTVHARDPKKAAEAQRMFAKVLELAAKNPKLPDEDPARAEAFRNAVGMAMVYTADAAYEEYLRVEIPDDLDYHVDVWKQGSGHARFEREYKQQVAKRERSIQRFGEFYRRKNELGERLVGAYGRVASSGSPYWTLAAAARTAVLSQNFADQLYRAEVPKSIKTEEMYEAYCDELADYAASSEKVAVEAFTYCLQRSTEVQYFNEFSRMCEEELQQRNPDKYPATNELFGRSSYTDSKLDVVGVQTTLTPLAPSKPAPRTR